MKFKKYLIPFVCAGMLTSACSDNKDSENKDSVRVDTNQIQQEGLTMSQTAENLALAGEQLFSPVSFMYADMVFDLALRADSNNKRAQFYKALIKPMMTMKGILKRVEPVVDTLPQDQQNEYNEFISKSPESGLKTFLMDGTADIQDEEDAQAFLDSYRNSWDDMRQFFKQNKDLDMEVNIMTIPGIENAMEKASEECIATSASEGVYEVDSCDYLKALKVNISRADVEVMQQIAAGMQIYLTLGTSYSANGTRDFVENNEDADLTPQQIIEHFSNETQAGKLRNDSIMKIKDIGVDAVAGARWALEIQEQLCPTGDNSGRNRPGSLFENGVCIKENTSNSKPTSEILNTIQSALMGGTIAISHNDDFGNEIAATEIAPVSPIVNPVGDLRSIAPDSYNECGEAKSLKDPSLGGVFVNGDANSYLSKTGVLKSDGCDE